MSIAYRQTTELELNGDIEAPSVQMQPRPGSALLVGVGALTLFFVTQMLQVFPGRDGLHIAKFTALAVVIMFISSRDRIASRVRISTVPQLKYILAIFAFAVITAPLSVWPSESLRFVLESYGKNILFIYFLIQVARSDRDSRMIAGTLIAGCSLLVIAMFTGHGQWVTNKDESRLAIGVTYDPNDLALLFVVTIPFAFFMLKSSRPLARSLLISSIGLMLVGMSKGASRGGFVGLLVIGTLILIRGSRQARKYTLMTIAIGVVIIAFTAPPEYWERIGTIFNYKSDYNLTQEGGRLKIWQTGLRMWASNPIAGVGINNFNTAYERYSGTERNISPHNIFIQISSELGTVGLLLFIAIIVASIRMARHIRRRAREGLAPAELWWFASAVEASFIGFLVSGFFLSHAYSAIFCFLTGMAAVLVARYKAAISSEADEREEIEYA